MRGKGAIADLVESGLFTLAGNPWGSGDLATYARQYGFSVKSTVIIRRTPPWAKNRLHLKGLSPAQLYVIRNLLEAMRRRLDDPVLSKLPASVAVKKFLKGLEVPAELKKAIARKPLTADELNRLIGAIDRMIQEARVAPAPVARGLAREVPL